MEDIRLSTPTLSFAQPIEHIVPRVCRRRREAGGCEKFFSPLWALQFCRQAASITDSRNEKKTCVDMEMRHGQTSGVDIQGVSLID